MYNFYSDKLGEVKSTRTATISDASNDEEDDMKTICYTCPLVDNCSPLTDWNPKNMPFAVFAIGMLFFPQLADKVVGSFRVIGMDAGSAHCRLVSNNVITLSSKDYKLI